MKPLKYVQQILVAAIVSSPLTLPSYADDTDIYLNVGLGGGGSASPPLVMLSLDFTPDLGSNECTNAAAASCEAHLTTELYDALDLVDSSGNIGPNGVADSDERTATQLATDYSGEKVTMFDGMRAVFRILFEELTDVYIAFMISHDDTCTGSNASGPDELPSGGSRGCSNGGYILKGFFDPTDATERANINAKLAAIPTPQGSLSHPYQLKEMYFEYFRYLTGQAVHNGHLGFDSYGSSDDRKNLGEGGNDVDPLLQWDGSIDSGAGNESATAVYTSPFSTALQADWSCTKVFAINVFDSGSNQEADSDDEIEDTLANGGLNLASGDNDVEGVIAAMRDTDIASATLGVNIDGDQSVTSYFVADNVNVTTNSMASAGGTGTAFNMGDPDEAVDSLRSIFREILSVSATFVAASVPVNVFNRAEVVDNVYLAIFEAESGPLWPGNIKKLKIAEVTVTDGDGNSVTSLQIQDADSDPAFSADDGRIKTDALTYWTNASGADVIAFDTDAGEVSGKDGRSVARGGAGQLIPQYLTDAPADTNATGTRQLYYDPSSGSTFVAFNAAAAATLQTALAAGSTTEAANLIKWARGIDVDNEDSDGSSTDARPWLMGDPMHSRPLVVNYGATTGYSTSNPNIHLFSGTNDGFFHIFENTTSAGAESGKELFAFMPQALMGNIATLRGGGSTTPPHPYGMDGEPVAYMNDIGNDGTISGSDKVYVYSGMRRGGKAYYALDASSPTTAASPPSLLWKIDNSTTNFTELGLTFSTPRVTTVNHSGTEVAALVFAGGYYGGWGVGSNRIGKDLNWNDDSEGRAVYVVNAATGALIWKAEYAASDTSSTSTDGESDMVDSIPSTVTIFDADGNGITDRAYVGDTGGAVWRIDLAEGRGDDSEWAITKLAELGEDNAANDRRFFHAPDVVKSRDGTGNYHGIIITSGNRADPKGSSVDNYLYMIKDRVTSSGGTLTGYPKVDETDVGTTNDLVDITDLCVAGSETNCIAADLSLGWKMKLESNGEKGLATPLTADGVIFATSYLPEGNAAAGSCAPSEGGGRLYAINLKNGSAAMNLNAAIEGSDKADRYTYIGPGIPPGAKPLGDQVLLPGTGIEGNQIVETGGRSRWKIYWRESGVDSL